jgi:hypothetical protein
MAGARSGKEMEKYIIKNPLAENKYPPHTPIVSFESKKYFPQINVSINYTYINQPIKMESIHTHDFDQFLCILGTPEDVRAFDGEVEIYLGEEGVKKTINKTSVAYIPKGLVHGPIIWKRVDKPIMLLNVSLSPEYSRKEVKAGSTENAEKPAGGNEEKYEKYIVREPYHWTIFPPYTPRLFFDAKNLFPETGFGIRYTYINQDIDMERPHSHDFDQVFVSLGTPEDISVFDAELESYWGADSYKIYLNTSTVTYVPAGMIHGPSLHRKVKKPMMLFNIILTPQYTRTDEEKRHGFINFLEIDARKVELEEAGQIIGAPVPKPAYLPAGYKIYEVYAENKKIRVLVSNKELVKKRLTVGDASGVHERFSVDNELEMSVEWFPEGKASSLLKVTGEPVAISRGNSGLLVDHENNIDLRWLLPAESAWQKPGYYEMMLSAGKGLKDELAKVACAIK